MRRISEDRTLYLNGELHTIRDNFDVWKNMYGDEIIEFTTRCDIDLPNTAFNDKDYRDDEVKAKCYWCQFDITPRW